MQSFLELIFVISAMLGASRWCRLFFLLTAFSLLKKNSPR